LTGETKGVVPMFRFTIRDLLWLMEDRVRIGFDT